jgi:hypothetical protein
MGAGFAYLGKQVPIQVGDRDFFLDLLFYHTHLHAGKLNFYIKAVGNGGDRATNPPSASYFANSAIA